MEGGRWSGISLLYFAGLRRYRWGTYPLLRRPVAPCIRTAPGSNGAPALPTSSAKKSVFRPLSCMRIPVLSQVQLLRPDLKRRSWQGFFSGLAGTILLRWSKKGDSLGVGAEKNPNAWRRLGSRSWTEPCHAGTEGFRVSYLRGYISHLKGEKGGKANRGGDRDSSGH